MVDTTKYLSRIADTSGSKKECPHYRVEGFDDWIKKRWGDAYLRIDCVDISIEKDTSYGPNYCHVTYKTLPRVLKGGVFVGGLVFDIGGTSIATALGGPFLTPVVTMGSGIATEWLYQKIDKVFNRWPGEDKTR